MLKWMTSFLCCQIAIRSAPWSAFDEILLSLGFCCAASLVLAQGADRREGRPEDRGPADRGPRDGLRLTARPSACFRRSPKENSAVRRATTADRSARGGRASQDAKNSDAGATQAMERSPRPARTARRSGPVRSTGCGTPRSWGSNRARSAIVAPTTTIRAARDKGGVPTIDATERTRGDRTDGPLGRVVRELKLTPEQQTKVDAELKEHHEKVRAAVPPGPGRPVGAHERRAHRRAISAVHQSARERAARLSAERPAG